MKLKVKFQWTAWLALAFVVGAFFIGFLFISDFNNCYELQELMGSLGWLAPIVFIFFSTVLIMLFVPRTLIMVLGGICFGATLGSVWVLVASLLSSVLSFGLARTYFRSWVERLCHKRNWFYRLQNITARSGFHFVLIARIAHFLHFGATSYACGVLNLSWSSFLLGTFWGVLPGTLVVVYSSRLLGCALWDGKAELNSKDITLIATASIIVLVISFLPWVFQRKKNP